MRYIEFFKEVLGVDVSHVNVCKRTLTEDDRCGEYIHGESCVYIDVGKIVANNNERIAQLLISTTIVHEIYHYIQYMHGKSLFLKTVVFDSTTDYYNNTIEADARLLECYYLFHYNGDKPSVRNYIKIITKHMDASTLIQYASNYKNKKFVECLIKSLKLEGEKSYGEK